MRKRITKSSDASTSRPSSGGGRPFGKKRVETESRFSKPSIKKSSLRIATGNNDSSKSPFDRSQSGNKPRFEKPRFDRQGPDKSRSFDRDEDFFEFKPKKEFSPRSDRGFDKTRFEKNSSERSFDKPRFEKPSSDRSFDKPRTFGRDGESRGFKPKGEFGSRDRFEGKKFEKPGFDKPYDKPRSFDRDGDSRGFKPRGEFTPGGRSEGRSFDKPRFEKSGDFKSKPANGRHERAGFKKKSDSEGVDFDPNAEKRAIQETENRRVGKFETAPKYNLSGYEKKPGAKRKEQTSEMRLNRYIANAGICSRREADELIASGQITVNGKVVTEMGHKVLVSDVVKFGKNALNPEKLVYVLINKPKDYITTTDDPEDRRTVLDLIKGACNERIYPVGRLDRNTTGLLLLTNDGELAEKLTHPSSGIKKIYQAELDKPMTTEDFEQLQAGVELEDGFIRPDEVGIVTPDAMVIGLEIHSGRNRIVRRMFEHLGYSVQKLDRTVFAGLNKKDLPRGKWRFLSEKEVVRLKFMI